MLGESILSAGGEGRDKGVGGRSAFGAGGEEDPSLLGLGFLTLRLAIRFPIAINASPASLAEPLMVMVLKPLESVGGDTEILA